MIGYIINLNERVDRWNRVKVFQEKSRHQIERFNAIKIKMDNATSYLSPRARADFLKDQRYQHEAIYGIGAVGCALSHLAIWRQFLATNHETCIVLEDDVDPKFAPLLDSKIKEMHDCDIFLLGWCGTRPGFRKDGTVIPFPRGKGFVGSHAYVLNRKAAGILALHMFPLEMQVDYAIQAISDQYDLKIRATKERIKQKFTGSWTNWSGSDIATFCLFCEPRFIYIAFGLLSSIITYLIYRGTGL